MSETEIRERLAPMIAAKIRSKCPGLAMVDAELLAHEIIARLQVALGVEAAEPGPVPPVD